mgnify:CR=1 FL=1
MNDIQLLLNRYQHIIKLFPNSDAKQTWLGTSTRDNTELAES